MLALLGFGIGAMIYEGLQFGNVLERQLKNDRGVRGFELATFELARPVLRGEQAVQMRQYQKPERQNRSKSRSTAKDYVEAGMSPAEVALFEKLRWWRMEAARKHNVAAFVIFHDSTMREIAKARPTSLAELRGVSGVGEKKLESYGREIISLIESLEA